jgi:hypothetical protein
MSACWKNLCKKDFDIVLTKTGKFPSYHDIYRLLYCSRILIGSYTYARYFNNLKPRIPNWLMYWASLSQSAPIMKYGRQRIIRRVKGNFLRHFNDMTYGQIRKIYNLDAGDLRYLTPTRFQRRTVYFSFEVIKYAGVRKHGSIENFMEYMLDKCYRSRGYVMRNYQKIIHSDPLLPL